MSFSAISSQSAIPSAYQKIHQNSPLINRNKGPSIEQIRRSMQQNEILGIKQDALSDFQSKESYSINSVNHSRVDLRNAGPYSGK